MTVKDPTRYVSTCHTRRRAEAPDDEAPWRDPDVLEALYHGEGMSLEEVGNELGVTDNTVLKYMRRHGIERRPQGKNRRTSGGKVREGVWGWDAEGNYRRLDTPEGEA